MIDKTKYRERSKLSMFDLIYLIVEGFVENTEGNIFNNISFIKDADPNTYIILYKGENTGHALFIGTGKIVSKISIE